jgi:hypothetical protein
VLGNWLKHCQVNRNTFQKLEDLSAKQFMCALLVVVVVCVGHAMVAWLMFVGSWLIFDC